MVKKKEDTRFAFNGERRGNGRYPGAAQTGRPAPKERKKRGDDAHQLETKGEGQNTQDQKSKKGKKKKEGVPLCIEKKKKGVWGGEKKNSSTRNQKRKTFLEGGGKKALSYF